MKAKITLITPPDFFENSSYSILLINPSDNDQEKITKFLSTLDSDENINIYFYLGEEAVEWLLYAVSKSKLTFFDLDNQTPISDSLKAYIVSHSTVYFQTRNKSLQDIYKFISNNQVPDVDYFLENLLKPNLEKTS